MQIKELHTFFSFLTHPKFLINFDKKKVPFQKKKLISVIFMQAHIRGFLTRKKLRKPLDSITFDMIYEELYAYNRYVNHGIEINKKLVGKHKKIRKPNFPSHISENIIKYYLFQKFNIMPNWGFTKSGDLTFLSKRIEVKAGQLGPTSFGPKESWDYLYFINCKRHLEFIFEIYFINLKNTDSLFRNLKVNKTTTYHDQCLQGKRPRINFSELRNQLGPKYCQLVFNNHLDKLRPALQ